MLNSQDAGRLTDYPPQVVLQAVLASNLTSFTEFAFGVVRPALPSAKLALRSGDPQTVGSGQRRGPASDHHLAAAHVKVALRIGGSAGLVPRT